MQSRAHLSHALFFLRFIFAINTRSTMESKEGSTMYNTGKTIAASIIVATVTITAMFGTWISGVITGASLVVGKSEKGTEEKKE